MILHLTKKSIKDSKENMILAKLLYRFKLAKIDFEAYKVYSREGKEIHSFTIHNKENEATKIAKELFNDVYVYDDRGLTRMEIDIHSNKENIKDSNFVEYIAEVTSDRSWDLELNYLLIYINEKTNYRANVISYENVGESIADKIEVFFFNSEKEGIEFLENAIKEVKAREGIKGKFNYTFKKYNYFKDSQFEIYHNKDNEATGYIDIPDEELLEYISTLIKNKKYDNTQKDLLLQIFEDELSDYAKVEFNKGRGENI